jgi:hypothetical protein
MYGDRRCRKVPAMTRSVLSIGVAVMAAALALAGCGGSSSSSKSTTPTTTPTTAPPASTQATTPQGSAARLTTTQWTAYQTANKTWTTANTKGVATFQKCSKITAASNASSDDMQKCLGDTITVVTTSTTAFGTTLHGFQATVGGQCSSTLNDYIGGLVSWNNVVAGIGHAISLNQLPSTANAPTAFNEIGTSAAAFVKACKPVG